MNEKHDKEKLSGFVNHELPHDEQQAIGEHLLLCADCRAEHDEIKLGAALAGNLKQSDAPANLWNKIENALDGNGRKVSLLPNFAFFSLRGLATALLISCALLAAVYFVFWRNNAPEIVKNETQSANVQTSRTAQAPQEIVSNQNTQPPEANSVSSPNINSKPQIAATNVKTLPKIAPAEPKDTLPEQANLPAWNVETLAGAPKAGNQTIAENGKLTVGETLETDANSKAKIEVANIGNVEIAPNISAKSAGEISA